MSSPSSMDAPWYVAGDNQAAQLGSNISGVPGYRDAKHDVILALMDLVEKGIAPESIIATKFVNDDPNTGVYRQRPICTYPLQAKNNGDGNVDMPESWTCESLY